MFFAPVYRGMASNRESKTIDGEIEIVVEIVQKQL